MPAKMSDATEKQESEHTTAVATFSPRHFVPVSKLRHCNQVGIILTVLFSKRFTSTGRQQSFVRSSAVWKLEKNPLFALMVLFSTT